MLKKSYFTIVWVICGLNIDIESKTLYEKYQIWYFESMQEDHVSNAILRKDLVPNLISSFYCE
jgi:hypothetical protein